MTEYNVVSDDDDQRLRPFPRELTNRASGSFENMSYIATRVGSRGSRHLARSFNANTNTDDDDLSEPLLGGENSVHYDSIYDSQEFSSQRNGIKLMRKRLKAHFMNPYEKFKKRGRKPWKLVIQMLKIILVTAQVITFSIIIISCDHHHHFCNISQAI